MKSKSKNADPSDLQMMERAQRFFLKLEEDIQCRELLREQNQRIEFDLSDADPFYVEIIEGRITLKKGMFKPRRFDSPDLIHLNLAARTLDRLISGEIRFTDALIPTDPNGQDSLLLLECTLLKWSILNWIGRLFIAGQLPTRFRN